MYVASRLAWGIINKNGIIRVGESICAGYLVYLMEIAHLAPGSSYTLVYVIYILLTRRSFACYRGSS